MATVPAMAIAGKLSVDETFLPPDFKKPAGRPQKKRKTAAVFASTKKKTCKACGSPGHFAKSCTQPSTEYRYNVHKKEAIQWCTRQQELHLTDKNDD